MTGSLFACHPLVSLEGIQNMNCICQGQASSSFLDSRQKHSGMTRFFCFLRSPIHPFPPSFLLRFSHSPFPLLSVSSYLLPQASLHRRRFIQKQPVKPELVHSLKKLIEIHRLPYEAVSPKTVSFHKILFL